MCSSITCSLLSHKAIRKHMNLSDSHTCTQIRAHSCMLVHTETVTICIENYYVVTGRQLKLIEPKNYKK